MVGYSVAELDDVQAKWGLRFPPDLIERLHERRLLFGAPDCFDWVTADPKRLAWPFESYWRSVERHEICCRNGASGHFLLPIKGKVAGHLRGCAEAHSARAPSLYPG